MARKFFFHENSQYMAWQQNRQFQLIQWLCTHYNENSIRAFVVIKIKTRNDVSIQYISDDIHNIDSHIIYLN